MPVKKSADTDETKEKKTAARKNPAKKTAAAEKATAKKAAETVKATADKKTTTRKSALKKSVEEKKETAPKTVRKRTTKKSEPKVNVVVEYAGKQVMADDVIASVTEAYLKNNPDTVVETIDLYIQPEKNVAYYVINGETGKNTKVRI